ncbi:MAG TPA: PEP-CTERM sorting domain-containing protein [Roseiarcus sp.]
MATATRPGTGAPFEIESADDFVLTHSTSITSATFTGLLPLGASAANVKDVVVEIYQVFPKDSEVGRTTGPLTMPPFQTPQVPTRQNSPSDNAFDTRDPTTGLTFSTRVVDSAFTAANSVTPGTINPKPGQTTGGDGAVRGEEVQFNVAFATPFSLPADHYFFVPQVQLDDGDFLWLSALRPIVSPAGTPFPPGFTDLQEWTRDAISPNNLDPDWLRVGTDIVGGTPAPTFNAAFSLSGTTIPEPSTWAMMLLGFAGLGYAGWRRARPVRPASA